MRLSYVQAAAALLFSLASPALAAPWEGVFEGTLGKVAILVELNAGPEKTEYKGGYSDGSRYSYLPKAFDLKLLLESEGESLEFAESTQPQFAIAELPKDDPARTGHWSIKVAGEKAVGTWTSADGKKTLPIKLKRLPLVANEDVPKNNSQLTATYNKRWFETEKISGAANPKTFGKVKLAFEKDSAFNLEMPVFTAMPDKAVMERANAMLRDYYRTSLIQNRDCINGLREEPSSPFEPEYGFEISYATPRVLSLLDSGSVDCGGAHPNNYAIYTTFDLVGGTRIGGDYDLDLSPQGFGTVLKLANKEERIAFEKFALGRWHDAAKAAGEEGDESCAAPSFIGEEAEGEKHFALTFTDKGLGIHRNDYPHVASNCLIQDFNPTIIPWTELKPWLRADQVVLTDEVK